MLWPMDPGRTLLPLRKRHRRGQQYLCSRGIHLQSFRKVPSTPYSTHRWSPVVQHRCCRTRVATKLFVAGHPAARRARSLRRREQAVSALPRRDFRQRRGLLARRQVGRVHRDSRPDPVALAVSMAASACSLPIHPWLSTRPRWSPDGTQIAYISVAVGKPWKIFLVSAQGGSPEELSARECRRK